MVVGLKFVVVWKHLFSIGGLYKREGDIPSVYIGNDLVTKVKLISLGP